MPGLKLAQANCASVNAVEVTYYMDGGLEGYHANATDTSDPSGLVASPFSQASTFSILSLATMLFPFKVVCSDKFFIF